MEGHSSSPPYSSTTGDEKRTHCVFNPYKFLPDDVRKNYGLTQDFPTYPLVFDLPASPEPVFEEESSIFGGDQFRYQDYCIGVGYVAGASLGVAKGIARGIRAAEPGESLKFRTRRVLRAGGQGWRRYGNPLGLMGMVFAELESVMMQWNGVEGDEGYLSTVAAGIGTGMLYKAFKGPRPIAIAGAIGGLVAGASVVGKRVVNRYMKF